METGGEMILSDKYQFIFMATPKTGTSTVHELLTPYGWRSPINEYANHLTVAGVKRCPPVMGDKKWKKYKKVGFIRNPWDRYVALWIMIDKWNGQKKYHTYGTLDEYILCGGHQGHHQYEFMLDNGIPILDFVGKFENFEEDVRDLFRFLKLPVPEKIHHSNKSVLNNRKHYTEYYTAKWMIDAVAEREKYVIETYGYKFGEDGDGWR
jgi:hypothetical protein